MVELHMFPHTVGAIQCREVEVATLRETAAVVSDAPADSGGRHTAIAHLVVLALHLGQVEHSCGPPVFLLLRQHPQSLQMTPILSSWLAPILPGRLCVFFDPGEVRGVAAWQGESRLSGHLTVRVKQCAKDHLLTLLTSPTSSALPLSSSPLSRLFSLPRLN